MGEEGGGWGDTEAALVTNCLQPSVREGAALLGPATTASPDRLIVLAYDLLNSCATAGACVCVCVASRVFVRVNCVCVCGCRSWGEGWMGGGVNDFFLFFFRCVQSWNNLNKME